MSRAPEIEMTEAQFQRRILDTAAVFGWRCHHARPAMTARGWRTPISGSPGFPDLVLARPGQLLVVELKSETGRLRPGQPEWLALLATVPGVAVHTWRPSDWPAALSVLSGGRAEAAS